MTAAVGGDATITKDSGTPVADAATQAAVDEAGAQQELGIGAPVTGWREGLDAEIRDHPALTSFQDVPSLAKSYLETKELVGRKGVVLPKEGDAADLARFRTEIGVPEKAEDYDLGDFAPPEGLPWSDGFQAKMLGRLHALGIPNSQVKDLFAGYAEEQAAEYQSMVETAGQGHEAGQIALRQELGREYDASVAMSRRAFASAAGDNKDELAHLVLADGRHLADVPAFVRTFINIGKQYQEAGLHGEKVGGGGFMKTPEQALEEIAAIEKNPALYNADDPEHGIIVKKKDELYEMAYPTSPEEVL